MIARWKAAWGTHERLLPDYLPVTFRELTSPDDQWHLGRWISSWYECGHTLSIWDRPVSLAAELGNAWLRRVPGAQAIAADRIEDLCGAALSLRIEFDPSTLTGDEGEPRRNGRVGTGVERLR